MHSAFNGMRSNSVMCRDLEINVCSPFVLHVKTRMQCCTEQLINVLRVWGRVSGVDEWSDVRWQLINAVIYIFSKRPTSTSKVKLNIVCQSAYLLSFLRRLRWEKIDRPNRSYVRTLNLMLKPGFSEVSLAKTLRAGGNSSPRHDAGRRPAFSLCAKLS